MIPLCALAVALRVATPAQPADFWPRADKVKHFLVSAFVHSAAFSVARAAGADRPASQAAGAATAMAVGIWKERRDRSSGGVFSIGDLTWDAAGSLSAAALLNGTR